MYLFIQIMGKWFVVYNFDTSNTCLQWEFNRSTTNPEQIEVKETRQLYLLDTLGVDHKHAITGVLDMPNPEVPASLRVRWPTCEYHSNVFFLDIFRNILLIHWIFNKTFLMKCYICSWTYEKVTTKHIISRNLLLVMVSNVESSCTWQPSFDRMLCSNMVWQHFHIYLCNKKSTFPGDLVLPWRKLRTQYTENNVHVVHLLFLSVLKWKIFESREQSSRQIIIWQE